MQYQNATGGYNTVLPQVDAYTKDETLSSLTKSLLGLNTDSTPNDAFNILKDSPYKVGDIKATARTDLGENWHLCDGTNIPVESDSEIVNLFTNKGAIVDAAIIPNSEFTSDNYDTGYALNEVGGVFVANGYLIHTNGKNAVYYNNNAQKAEPLTGLQNSISTSDGIAWVGYLNGYYIVLTGRYYSNYNSYTQMYYSKDLFGSYSKVNKTFQKGPLGVIYYKGQYILQTSLYIYFASDLTSTWNIKSNVSNFDTDYDGWSFGAPIKDDKLFKCMIHRNSSSTWYMRIYSCTLPLTSSDDWNLEKEYRNSNLTNAQSNVPQLEYHQNRFIISYRNTSDYNGNIMDNSFSSCASFNYIPPYFIAVDSGIFSNNDTITVFDYYGNKAMKGSRVSSMASYGNNYMVFKFAQWGNKIVACARNGYKQALFEINYKDASITLPNIACHYIKIK